MLYYGAGRRINETTYNLCTSRRTYGIELELANAYECSHDHKQRGMEGRFGCQNDCSIECDDDEGAEFYSPILLGDAGFRAIDNFCEDAVDTDPNDSCGFHIHIGISDMTEKQRANLVKACALIENVARMLVDAERSDNSYCSGWVGVDPDSDCSYFLDMIDCGRYRAFNFEAWDKHRTLEIRLHEATNRAEVVKNWVKLWLAFVDYVAADKPLDYFKAPDEVVFDRLVALAGDDVAQFYTRRAIRFGYGECLRKEAVSV